MCERRQKTNEEGATSNIRQSDTGLAALPIHEGCNLVILTKLLSLFNCLCVVWLRRAKLPEFSHHGIDRGCQSAPKHIDFVTVS